MANILITGEQCSEESVIGEDIGTRFECIPSESSAIFTQDNCCPECTSPVIVSDLYAGQTVIPYSINMPNGTVVSYNGVDSVSTNGKGAIPVEALNEGELVILTAVGVDCNTESCEIQVKPISEQCDCPIYNPCSITVNSLLYEVVDVLYGKISSLSVSSSGALKYKLDNGDWNDNWNAINNFTLGDSHILHIKMAKNPTCKIELPLIVIDTIN